MKLSEKFLILAVVISIILSGALLTSCGGSDGPEPSHSPDITSSPAPSSDPSEPPETPEPTPQYTPHPDDTVSISLAEKGSPLQEDYEAMPGETLKFSFDCDKPLYSVSYVISPDSGAIRTVTKAAYDETPGTFYHFINITESMASRTYTFSATGFDENGSTVVSFNPVTVKVCPSLYNVILSVDNKNFSVKAYDDIYSGNTYLCLSDVSSALKGTKKACSLERPSGSINDSSSRWLNVNDNLKRYYSYLHFGKIYSKTLDVCLMADINMRFTGGVYSVNTSEDFTPDLGAMKSAGIFDGLSSALLGNCETGDIYFSLKQDVRIPIASISKLMTYMVLRDNVKSGRVSSDNVRISIEATAVSLTEDGVFYLPDGKTFPLSELTAAMLLSSSNESAVAIACHVAGTEEAFVKLMNNKAREIGLTSAVFYNASGLPAYSGGVYSAKTENSMTTDDLFKLLCHIIKNYPEITEYTSEKYYTLKTLGITATNSNPLVFNVPGCIGFKTGTTNRAGYCLVSAAEVKKGTHIVCIVMGAENNAERDRLSEILIKNGVNR